MSEDFLDLGDSGLGETFDWEIMAKGEEVELRVISMNIDRDKNGKRYMMPFFEVVGEPRVKEFGDYMPLPDPKTMNEKELNKARIRIRNFGEAFGVDFSRQVDVREEVIGATGGAILGIGTDQDDQPINKVNKYVTGR